MIEKPKARGAVGARAPEDVRIEQQNTWDTIGSPSVLQPITGYKHDKQLMVIAVYRGGVHHE